MVSPPPSPDEHAAYRAYCEAIGVAYVPGFVQRMPTWSDGACLAPCCSYVFVEPVPERAGACPACGDRYWIRTCPDGVRRLLTETAMVEVEALEAEAHVQRTALVATVTEAGGSAGAHAEALEQVRLIARGRVLARHGRAPWPDDGGALR